MVIVTLTTWQKRIENIPSVLDSIFRQTIRPDLVVLNLAIEEVLPVQVENYIKAHNVELNRVPDTKVYKKILPTILKYKEADIICIDDDFVYPEYMIADFLNKHKKHPKMPLTGNYIVYKHLNCHCGCASFVKYEYFGEYLEKIDDDVIRNCPSDDILFTYFAAKTGHYYIRTKETYFLNMKPIGGNEPYSDRFVHPEDDTWAYLSTRFGPLHCKNVLAYLCMVLKRRLKVLLSFLY